MRVRVLTSNMFKRWEPFCVQNIKWKCHRAQDTLILRACRISLSPVQTDATLLAKNPEHFYTLHIVSFCLPCCMLLYVVRSCCAKFETGQTFSYVQTDATTPNNVAASCCQQCCVPLHEALDRTFEAMMYRQYMSFELEVQLKNFHIEVNVSLACS